MAYKITEQARQNPNLFPLPYYPHELVGVGGNYEVNEVANCPSCNPEQQAAFDKEQINKPKRFFREAEPHEYEALSEQYKGSGGIPGYLINIPTESKPQAVAEKK